MILQCFLKKKKRYLEKIILLVKIVWVFFPWVLMMHFQTAGAESDISRFSNKDKKILMCHYIPCCSLSSLMPARPSFLLLLLSLQTLQSNASAFALLPFCFCACQPCHCLSQLCSQLAHCFLSIRPIG